MCQCTRLYPWNQEPECSHLPKLLKTSKNWQRNLAYAWESGSKRGECGTALRKILWSEKAVHGGGAVVFWEWKLYEEEGALNKSRVWVDSKRGES